MRYASDCSFRNLVVYKGTKVLYPRVAAHEEEKDGWVCDKTKNFIANVEYEQVDLTDACPHCDAHPVYDTSLAVAPKCTQPALKACKAKCDVKVGCDAFFYQRHLNGHEVCGFYSTPSSLAAVQANRGQWDGHQKGSQICRRAVSPQQPPTAPKPAFVDGTISFQGLSSTEVQSYAYHLALRVVVARGLGPFCGPNGTAACSASDVKITSGTSVSLSFRFTVASEEVAVAAAAKLSHFMAQAQSFTTALVTAGMTTLRGAKGSPLVVAARHENASASSSEDNHEEEEEKTTLGFLQSSKAVACAVVAVVVVLVVMGFVVMRGRRGDPEYPAHAVPVAHVAAHMEHVSVKVKTVTPPVRPPAYKQLSDTSVDQV